MSMGHCEGACSAGAVHNPFNVHSKQSSVCHYKAFSTITTEKSLCKCNAKIQTGICIEKIRVNTINLPLHPSLVLLDCQHIYKNSQASKGAQCLKTEIAHACGRERDPVLKRHFLTQNSMTKSLRNDSRTNDAITVGCLFGCHDTLQAQIVLLQ